MLSPIVMYALRNKFLKMEADRHGLGWQALPPSVHLITFDGRQLRLSRLAAPSSVVAHDLPHERVRAYARAAGETGPVVTATAAAVLAVAYVAEVCPGCLRRLLPGPLHRLVHARWHRPMARMLDAAASRYVLRRDRDHDGEVVLLILPPPVPSERGDPGLRPYHAMVELLEVYRRRSASARIVADGLTRVDERQAHRRGGVHDG